MKSRLGSKKPRIKVKMTPIVSTKCVVIQKTGCAWYRLPGASDLAHLKQTNKSNNDNRR